MDMQNNKRRNVLTQARVNFSQSETSSLLRGGGGGLNFELLLWGGGGVNRKDPTASFYAVRFCVCHRFAQRYLTWSSQVELNMQAFDFGTHGN